MRLYKPTKPGTVNQPFAANPSYYGKFNDGFGNALLGHDGIDFYAVHGTPIYAAHEGMGRVTIDTHGGQGVVLRSLEKTPDGFPTTMYWHLIGNTDTVYPSPIPMDGAEYPIAIGQLIGFADNTGAPFESSGDHLHFGLFFVDSLGNIQNQHNGFNGRVDPKPYFTGIFAEDVQPLIEKESLLISLLKKVVELLTKK